MIQELGIAVLLLLLLLLCLEVGFRIGGRARGAGEPKEGGQLGAIQGGTLGLLALLLAFSFGGAATRFMERQDLIVQEANAIGTAYLRADMLDEPYRSNLRADLCRYVEHRVRATARGRGGISPEDLREVARLQDRIWNSASAGVAARPTSMLAVLAPVNEVIDLHSTRLAAARKHIPGLVLWLLIVCSAMSLIDIGYGCGLARRRSWLMTSSLAVLLAASLWTTIDLEYPRAGLIQLDDTPMVELEANLSQSAAVD
jgi:hypothetical protein